MVLRRIASLTLVLVVGDAIADQSDLPVAWTQDRIAAVVRVETRYPGYTKPGISTGFILATPGRYYAVISTHSLHNDYPADPFTYKPPGSDGPQDQCLPIPDLTSLVIKRGEGTVETLQHDNCAIHRERDISLIPLVPRPGGYPTLRLVARTMHKHDRVYLAGYANGWSSLDTVGNGLVGQFTDPPDELGVAHIPTAPGMSGGPYLWADGSVVGLHRGGLPFSPIYAHFTRIEKARATLEPVVGPIHGDPEDSPTVTSVPTEAIVDSSVESASATEAATDATDATDATEAYPYRDDVVAIATYTGAVASDSFVHAYADAAAASDATATATAAPTATAPATDVATVTDPDIDAEEGDLRARYARIGDLLALSSVTSLSGRVGAWEQFQGRKVTTEERRLFTKLPVRASSSQDDSAARLAAAASSGDRGELAQLIQQGAAKQRASCWGEGVRISDGQLTCDNKPVFVPGASPGRPMEPRFIVIHHTASIGLDQVVQFMTSKSSKVSAHFVIDRDGSIVQLVPTTRTAGHAGRSEWRGTGPLNAHSIAIEFVGAGKLHRRQDGKFGGDFGSWTVPENEVVAVGEGDAVAYWHRYTAAQMASAESLAKAIAAAHRIEDIIGHCSVAPTRFVDPGPAFPLRAFGEEILGHGVDDCP